MPEKVITIAGGNYDYQVLKSEDGNTVTIRHASNPSQRVELRAAIVPQIMAALDAILKD